MGTRGRERDESRPRRPAPAAVRDLRDVGPAGPRRPLLELQRLAGNAAVARAAGALPVQRTVLHAVVAISHLGVNARWPIDEGAVLDTLVGLWHVDRTAFGILRDAWLKDLPADEQQAIRARIDDRLRAPSDSDSSGWSSDAASDSGTDEEYRAQQAAEKKKDDAVAVATAWLEAAVSAAPGAIESSAPHGAGLAARLRAGFASMLAHVTGAGADRFQCLPEQKDGDKLAGTGKGSVKFITLYKPWFDQAPDERARVIVHELAHAALGVDDLAYTYEAKFRDLTVDQHLDNADSWALPVLRLNR